MEDKIFENKNEMSWKGLILKLSVQLKEALVKLFVCSMYIAIALIAGASLIVFVYLLVANKSSYELEHSRLATQLEILLETTANSSSKDLSGDQKQLLISQLIKNYKPETDSLKPSFNPEEDKLPTVQDIVDLVKSKISDKGNDTLDGVSFPKEDDKFSGSKF